MADEDRKASDVTIDMVERDPNNLQGAIQTNFDDVIGEPDGAHSADCIWQNAFKCFTGGKGCCYNCLTFVCALPLALCWGCQFACITFCNIWWVTPCLRAFNMNFVCIARLYKTMVHCCWDPCNESLALIFTKIYIHRVESDGYKSIPNYEQNLLKGYTKSVEDIE